MTRSAPLVTALNTGTLTLTIENASGTTLATGTAGPTNVGLLVNNYTAPAAGVYYIAVAGTAGTNYSLVVTHNAVFDSEPNDSFATAQALGSALGAVGAISGPTPNNNWYSINVTSTANDLILTTSTPADGPGEFDNQLFPNLQLYSPAGSNGTLVASGTLLADGRNQTIQYQPTTTGIYRIDLSGASGTTGEYFLSAGIVVPNAATHFVVAVPGTATAGNPFIATVTALSSNNNTSSGYAGTVHFTSSDSQAVLPSNATLTNGSGYFIAILNTSGLQTLTATDTASTSITGSAVTTVNTAPGPATHFTVSAPAATNAGTPFVVVVTALDQFNNTATGYTGRVHISSSDPQVGLPVDATLTNGIGYFGVVLKTAGVQTLTATDTAAGSIVGTSNAIIVNGLAASHFAVAVPSNAITGIPFNFTVTALDPFNNLAPAYAGTAQFTSSDSAATLPAITTLSNGVGIFSATFMTPGNQTLAATDVVSASIAGISNTIVTRGLTVSSLTPTPTGFVATFDKPFVASDINLYDSASGGGVDDVLLTGPNSPQISFHGSVIIDPSDQTITFVKTSNFTGVNFNPGSGVLSAGTYTVTFQSAVQRLRGQPRHTARRPGQRQRGRQQLCCDFRGDGTAGGCRHPGLRAGPDSVDAINLPNSATTGIPVNVSVGIGITSGTFTLQYNPAC